MLEAQGIHQFVPPRSPQQRAMAIAVVAGLHVLVLATIITAMAYHPPVAGSGPIKMVPVADQKPSTPTTKPPTVVLIIPGNPLPPTPIPTFRIEDPATGGITRVEGPPTTGTVHETVFVAARAIAGTHTIPEYPMLDKRLGHEGNVLLRLSLDPTGAIADAIVERSSGFDGLDRAAAEWVKSHWRYSPATRGGAAVASTVEVTVTFRLTNG